MTVSRRMKSPTILDKSRLPPGVLAVLLVNAAGRKPIKPLIFNAHIQWSLAIDH
jgi:hypothetical protein